MAQQQINQPTNVQNAEVTAAATDPTVESVNSLAAKCQNNFSDYYQKGASGTGTTQRFTSGASGTVNAGVTDVILDGVGTTFALTFPVALFDKQQIYIMFATAISTAFSITGSGDGSTVKAPPATPAAGSGCGYQYNAANTTWYRLY